MNFEQALEIVTGAFARKLARPLTQAEVALLFGAWHDLTYERIAERSGYTLNYLQRDIGPKFWKRLSQVLGQKVNKTTIRAVLTYLNDPLPVPRPSSVQRWADWGEAMDVSGFQGRAEEQEHLTHWIARDRCRLVAIVGMGGIGKSALAAKVAQRVQGQFECVIWRSLRNAPPLETLLAELVPFLSQQQDVQATPERLLHWLQTHRCLVILDNQETLLQPGERAGTYQPQFVNYRDLFERLGTASHQSCVLLTSREQSAEVATLEDAEGAVRRLALRGSWKASLALIEAKRLIGTAAEKQRLCDLYRGNLLAIKMVATSIQSLFDGEIAAFFQSETPVFNGIRRLLDQQFQRLSALEQTIMNWLAINREWTTIAELQADIVPKLTRASLLDALESLTWRSLIEKRSGEYTQQPVVMEYVTDRLIQQIADELLSLQTISLNRYALIKTNVLDYIQKSQRRVILTALIEQLKTEFHDRLEQLAQHLQLVLTALRAAPESALGYGVGNWINLCLHLPLDLTGCDFSHLTIRQADLQGATLQQVNFQAAHFIQSTFTQGFGGGLLVRWSPNGLHFAIGDAAGGVQIWQYHEMQPLLTIQAHSAWVWAADWHPEGTILATGCVDRSIKAWDTRTGQLLRGFEGYPDSVFALAWSPDGQWLAGGGQGPCLMIWDRLTGDCVARLETTSPAQDCWVWSLKWLAQGAVLAAAYTDQTIKLWDTSTGECIQTIQAHDHWVVSLSLHPNGKILASSGYDKTIKLWNWQTGQCLQAITTHECVWWLEWSPDGEKLAGGGYDYTVRLWDQALQCLHVWQEHQNWVWAGTWSRDGTMIASASHDQTVKFWNAQTGHCVKTLRGNGNSSWCVKWSKDGVRLLSSSTNRTVQLWSTQTGECLRIFRGHDKEVMSVAWSPNERLIASCSADTTVRIWEVQTGRCLNILRGHYGFLWSVAWSPDGQRVVSCGHDSTIKIWDVHSGQCLLTLADHDHYVISVVWCPETDQIASGSMDETIRFWDLKQGVCTRIIHVNHSVHSLAFSPDGEMLLSGDYEKTVKLWRVNSGECLRTFQGHAVGHIMSVSWSADSSRVASACSDSTIRIWQVQTGNCEQVIQGNNLSLSVDWNPKNNWLATAFMEQPLQIWDSQTQKMVQTLISRPPYEGMNITGVTGISEAQKTNLKALGAVSDLQVC